MDHLVKIMVIVYNQQTKLFVILCKLAKLDKFDLALIQGKFDYFSLAGSVINQVYFPILVPVRVIGNILSLMVRSLILHLFTTI